MSASYKFVSQAIERSLVGDARNVKFRESNEGDDEAMVGHHERLGEESSAWELESLVRMHHVKVSSSVLMADLC